MRNAVIRKKHLEEQRLYEQFMRTPQRIVLGANTLQDYADIDWADWAKRIPILAL